MSDSTDKREELEKIILTWSSEITGERRDKLAPDALTLLDKLVSWHEKEIAEASKITGDTSDGFHTFNELYHYRMLYNALYVNELVKRNPYAVHKSKRHSDGELCFGGGWFVVVMDLPTGQVSNHYELKDWDLFRCAELEEAPEWDGHTPQEAAERLLEALRSQVKVDKEGE